MHEPLPFYYDNSVTVINSKEPRNHERSKHIERKYHVIRDIVQCGDVVVLKIPSIENLADPFTKIIHAKSFKGHLEGLKLRDKSHFLRTSESVFIFLCPTSKCVRNMID